VTVKTLSIKGCPSQTHFLIARAVWTLNTTTPTSIGKPPEGTSFPVIDFIRCFSLPCGYFSGRTFSSISQSIFIFFIFSLILPAMSILFFSIPI